MDNIQFIQTSITMTSSIYPSPILDIAGITGDYTIFLRVINLIGDAVTFAFNDSMDGFATAGAPGPAFSMKGPITREASVVKSFSRRDFPSLRLGTPGAKLRLVLAQLLGDASKTVTFESWIQYATPAAGAGTLETEQAEEVAAEEEPVDGPVIKEKPAKVTGKEPVHPKRGK